MATPLLHADILDLSGKDATAFAHAQFTTDVRSLAPLCWQWSAWLDPQGRAQAVFVLLRTDADRFLMWLPLGGAQALRDRLARFVMRSAVHIERLDDWTLHRLDAADGITTLPDRTVQLHNDGYAFAQPGPEPRVAWLAAVAAGPLDSSALAQWRRADIASRLPLLPPELAGEYVPQALDLERLDAIRFDKGCYPGQEIAARLHFRGGNKRRLRQLRVDGDGIAPATTVLSGDGREAGRILYAAADDDGLASDAIAVLADANDTDWVTTDGRAVRGRD
jgi:folate-binding protein YgfZ